MTNTQTPRPATTEPEIIINGKRLTNGQALTARVAITTFAIEMAGKDPLGDDKTGRQLSSSHLQNADEVLSIMKSNN